MSLFYRFKPQKDSSLSSITTQLDGAGVTANEVTALGLSLALGAGLLAYNGHLYAALILFTASAACDALDGSLARVSEMGTEFGLYFDGVADRFSEFFFVSGAVLGAQVPSSAFVLVGGGFALLLARIYGHVHPWAPCPLLLGGLSGWHSLWRGCSVLFPLTHCFSLLLACAVCSHPFKSSPEGLSSKMNNVKGGSKGASDSKSALFVTRLTLRKRVVNASQRLSRPVRLRCRLSRRSYGIWAPRPSRESRYSLPPATRGALLGLRTSS